MKYEIINDKYKVIAKIDYNDKHYIYYTDGKNIGVGYFEDNKIKPIKDEKEAKMLCYIFEELKKNVSKHEYIDYGFTFYKDVKYKMIYDTNTRRRFFFEVGEDICKSASGEALEYLDKKFNSDLEVLYEDGLNGPNKSGKKKCLSKRIKFALFGGFCFAAISTELGVIDHVLDSNYILQLEEIDYPKDVKCPEDIVSLIDSNDKIDDRSKEFLKSLDKLYNDNYKYMDNKFLTELLPNLKITYAKNKQKEYEISPNIIGIYQLKDNKIVIFEDNKFNKNNYRTLLHEYIHTLSYGGFAFDDADGVALMEGLTELITAEYVTDMDNTPYEGVYEKQQAYAKMLFEIIGVEPVLKAYFGHDYNTLLNELNKYTDNEFDSNNLIRLINDEKVYEDEYTLNNKDIKDPNGELKSIQDKIDVLFKKFFLNSKGYDLDDDRLMCTYMDQVRGTNTAHFNVQEEENVKNIIVEKFYVSEYLKSDIAFIKYNYRGGISVKSNPGDFFKLDDGTYSYINELGEEIIYDEIPDEVTRYILYSEVDDETRVKSFSKH